jgi:phenylacetaldehyde dehydrogenase
VVEQLSSRLATVAVGNEFEPDVFIGPLGNAAQKVRVQGYIDAAIGSGCQVVRGAPVPDEGYFVSRAIVTGAAADHPVTCEEIFGPVLSVYSFTDEDEALACAAARIWSRDIDRVMRVARDLECGKVIVNSAGFPYPALPEGGTKASGHGRDLGRAALDAHLATKSVLIKLGAR